MFGTHPRQTTSHPLRKLKGGQHTGWCLTSVGIAVCQLCSDIWNGPHCNIDVSWPDCVCSIKQYTTRGAIQVPPYFLPPQRILLFLSYIVYISFIVYIIISRGNHTPGRSRCNRLQLVGSASEVLQLIPINAHATWQPRSCSRSLAMGARGKTRSCYSGHNCASTVSFSM